MNVQQAIDIREEAVRLVLEDHCDQCLEDIETLNSLKGGRPGAFAIIPPSHPQAVETTQKTEPVLGTRIEDAARRLRRVIRNLESQVA
jgi:hypothetical protein